MSDFLVVYPQTPMTMPGKHLSMTMKVDEDASRVAVYRTSSDNGFATWTKLDTEVDGEIATFKAEAGGVYVARSHSYTVFLTALCVALVVVALIAIGGIVYYKRNPSKWKKLKGEAKNVKRNFAEAV